MNDKKIVSECKKIMESISSQYNCNVYADKSAVPCKYVFKECLIANNQCVEKHSSYDFVEIGFKLKVDLCPENMKKETAKFNILQPIPTFKDGPYEVITLSSETIAVYCLWGAYKLNGMVDQDGSDIEWRKYTPGDVIVGEPQVRIEPIKKPSDGKVGSSVYIKLLRCDLVEYSSNVLQLERFLSKYCPVKLEKAKE